MFASLHPTLTSTFLISSGAGNIIMERRKGQQEVLTIIIITGILFGVVASVWVWATPIVEGNKDLFLLRSTEDFSRKLSESIKFVARNGGRADLKVAGLDPRGSMLVRADGVDIFTTTRNSQYEKNVEVPLKDLGCAASEADWGINTTDSICVLSTPVGQEKVTTRFSVKFIQLNHELSGDKRGYKIVLVPLKASSGLDKDLVLLENLGTQQSTVDGRTVVSTLVAVDVV